MARRLITARLYCMLCVFVLLCVTLLAAGGLYIDAGTLVVLHTIRSLFPFQRV